MLYKRMVVPALVLLFTASRSLIAQNLILLEVDPVTVGIDVTREYENPAHIRSRYVRIDENLIQGNNLEQAGLITLQLFSDVSVEARRLRMEDQAGAGVWVGRPADDQFGYVILSLYNGVLYGKVVRDQGDTYLLKHRRDEIYAVSEVNADLLPSLLENDVLDDPALSAAEPVETHLCDAQNPPCTDPIIDLMIVYTPAAAGALGENVEDRFALLAAEVVEANQVNENSQAQHRYRLVHRAEVAYSEEGDLGQDLNRLQALNDGYMDVVHELRDDYGADLVALLSTSYNWCGMALALRNAVPLPHLGFNANNVWCFLSGLTFEHELGHNLGLAHDWYSGTAFGVCRYGIGYINDNADDDEDQWKTIQAYPNKCTEQGFGCVTVPYYSNPNITYGPYNTPMGVPHTSPVEPADAVRAVDRSTCLVQQYRQGIFFGGILPFPHLAYSTVAWGDFDNDGDLDVALAGDTGQELILQIFRNAGSDNFTLTVTLPGLREGDLDWGDFDNDGDLDLLAMGLNGSTAYTIIYRNNGDDTFTNINAGLPGLFSGTAQWADFNNDGWLDFVLTGRNASGTERSSRLYRNNGDGTFSNINAGLTGLSQSDAAWGDYDNDGDHDLLLMGSTGTSFVTLLYRNNGDGTFSEVTDTGLEGMRDGEVHWGDYDNDGDLDIFLTGENNINRADSRLYRNQNLTFIWDETNLLDARVSSGHFGDFDNDGDLDLAIMGYASGDTWQTAVYLNTGVPDYVSYSRINTLSPVGLGSARWADYDNDGDLDLLTTGWNGNSRLTLLYRFDAHVAPNTAPTAPDGLHTTVNGNQVTFNWNPATDSSTPSTSLSYNLRVGSGPGQFDVLAPMSAVDPTGTGKSASVTLGYRKVVRDGNTGLGTSWTLGPLTDGTYCWSVQALDHSYSGSAFADEQCFTLGEADVQVPLKAWLQGAYNPTTGQMRTHLHTTGLIPLSSPYDSAPWNCPTRSVTALPNADIVDWVCVALRQNSTAASTVAKRAGFITKTGHVVDLDGTSPLTFPEVSPDYYYAVLYHRNHLAAMSAGQLSVSPHTPLFDFTEDRARAFGGDLYELDENTFALYGGDANADGHVMYIGADRDQLAIITLLGTGSLANVTTGYYGADMNLDGRVAYIGAERDQLTIINTLGLTHLADIKTCNVPGAGDAVTKTTPTEAGYLAGESSLLQKTETGADVPATYRLGPAYPNPFNATTRITYALPQESMIRLDIYNVLGQHIKTLVDEVQSAGFMSVVWDGIDEAGRRVPSGVYLYRITAGDFVDAEQIVFLR